MLKPGAGTRGDAMDLADLVEETERNNLMIRSMLRDTDTETLVAALADLEESVRGAFLRNVSKRTRAAIEHDLGARGSRITRDRRAAAREHLERLLSAVDERTPAETATRPRRPAPAVRVGSQREIIETFNALAQYVEEHGLLALEELEPAVADPFVRRGIAMVVDGWDALDWRAVMQNHKETLVHALETRLSMILDGLESVQSGEAARVVEQRLAAYLAPS